MFTKNVFRSATISGIFGNFGETISNTWDKVSGFFNWWGSKDEALAQAEVIAELPKKLDATNPQSMIAAAEASEALVNNVAAIEGANLEHLAHDANQLASEIAQVKASVLHEVGEIDAALEVLDYNDHGMRLMETLSEGILAGKHFVTSALSSVLADAREYLPSSPAKRGPLSDIHRLKFMETVAASISATPLLTALENTMGLARDAMDVMPAPAFAGRANYAPLLQGSNGAAPRGDRIEVKFENHYHGEVDEKTIADGNDDLMRKMDAWWRTRQNETTRRGY